LRLIGISCYEGCGKCPGSDHYPAKANTLYSCLLTCRDYQFGDWCPRTCLNYYFKQVEASPSARFHSSPVFIVKRLTHQPNQISDSQKALQDCTSACAASDLPDVKATLKCIHSLCDWGIRSLKQASRIPADAKEIENLSDIDWSKVKSENVDIAVTDDEEGLHVYLLHNGDAKKVKPHVVVEKQENGTVLAMVQGETDIKVD